MPKWIGNGDGSAPRCDIERYSSGADPRAGKHDMTLGFVDGATVMGPWALMCLDCHQRVGRGLGPGRGQRYDGTTYEKVEG